MDAEKIIQDLNRRFSAPLTEFHKRRTIFGYDEDRKFEEQLDDILIDRAIYPSITAHTLCSD